MSDWGIYKGVGKPQKSAINDLPPPPSWRRFTGEVLANSRYFDDIDDPGMKRHLGYGEDEFQVSPEEIELVNAALYLRRPLLVTGKPGCGKSSLAYAIARELDLGPVLSWSITTRTTLQDGLYSYDAIGRLQDASLKHTSRSKFAAEESEPDSSKYLLLSEPDIGKYLRLGPLGTALLPFPQPRVLLIDEIDKSDIDLPNDLLNIFEEGSYKIHELSRLSTKEVHIMPDDGEHDGHRVLIKNGEVSCYTFPLIVLTSNGEREFPAPFLRRCLRLDIKSPDKEKLARIVMAHFDSELHDEKRSEKLDKKRLEELIDRFLNLRDKGDLATDQLLNAVYLTSSGVNFQEKQTLSEAILRYLSS
jgi:MoxR-like ATPase